MTFPGKAAELPEDARYCTCCYRPLKGRIAWLERNCWTGKHSDRGDIPEEQSQGWFPFGLTCARNLKRAAVRGRIGQVT